MSNWHFGWTWQFRIWYYNFWYDGPHYVLHLGFLQIEYYP